MTKVKLETGMFSYPMPVALAGATVEGKPNFMAVAWFSRVDFQPSRLAIAISKGHYTTRGVEEHGVFSLNLPSRDLVVPTDYVGLHSGKKVDKAAVFDVFYGELETAPMIEQCPLCVECRVVEKLELAVDRVYVGEEVAVYAEEAVLTEGAADFAKVQPYVLAMPANEYYAVGEAFAKAWRVGQEYGREAE
jgi:flavin reductase (DIM6/NTAB) family NADH-FMN oxidoreductase RutF